MPGGCGAAYFRDMAEKDQARVERLARALRENLKRRKAQARGDGADLAALGPVADKTDTDD